VTAIKVRLTFPEHLITEPVLGRATKEFDVLPNIRRASVDDKVGLIVCELSGKEADVKRAIDWMRGLGVQVDLLGDVVES
jgi:ABC-type methionine transport system ATPase subunit